MKNKSQKIKSFTDLLAWQEAHLLVLKIYLFTGKFPKSELFGIISQLRRTMTSVTANIAEGFGRYSYKDRIKFYIQARGSILEVENFIITARDLKYLKTNNFDELWQQSEKVANILNGLINSTKKFIK
jgi:four helix bundle protein